MIKDEVFLLRVGALDGVSYNRVCRGPGVSQASCWRWSDWVFKDEFSSVLLYLGSTQWRWQDCVEVLGIQSIICQTMEKCPHDIEIMCYEGILQKPQGFDANPVDMNLFKIALDQFARGSLRGREPGSACRLFIHSRDPVLDELHVQNTRCEG